MPKTCITCWWYPECGSGGREACGDWSPDQLSDEEPYAAEDGSQDAVDGVSE